MRLKRTHNNVDLRASDIGKEVVLSGWVHKRRDHGGLIFIDLRDRWGLTQVVFDPDRDPEAHKAAEHIRAEYVISVHGYVNNRKEGMVNPRNDVQTDVACYNRTFHLDRLPALRSRNYTGIWTPVTALRAARVWTRRGYPLSATIAASVLHSPQARG